MAHHWLSDWTHRNLYTVFGKIWQAGCQENAGACKTQAKLRHMIYKVHVALWFSVWLEKALVLHKVHAHSLVEAARCSFLGSPHAFKARFATYPKNLINTTAWLQTFDTFLNGEQNCTVSIVMIQTTILIKFIKLSAVFLKSTEIPIQTRIPPGFPKVLGRTLVLFIMIST